MVSQSLAHIDAFLDRDAVRDLADRLAKKWPRATVDVAVREVTLTVAAADVVGVMETLRDTKTLAFTQMMDLCGVDYLGFEPAQPARFAVVYHLLSLAHNLRLRVKVWVADGVPVPTVTGVYSAAIWYEREAYDMYGIVFEGHPDLRRILTDYGFEGFPLRKDFPLEGHVEVYYDADGKRVAYKPVDLPQEFRHFDSVSPWKGATGNARLAEEDNAVFNKEEWV